MRILCKKADPSADSEWNAIYCQPNSYAEQYAKENDIPYNTNNSVSSGTNMKASDSSIIAYEEEDDPVDMANEDEVRDAVVVYLSTLPIKAEDFENVVDNYVDLIMENGYSSMSEWWSDFIENNEQERLENMGYLLDTIHDDDEGLVTL